VRGRPLSLTAELQRVNVETNLSIETTDIVRGLDMIRTADPRKLFRTRKVRGRLVEEIKPITELDDATALAIKSALQFEPAVVLTSVPFHLERG
jgi:hypothetical protein